MKYQNNYKTTIIGICLILITVAFVLSWIDLSQFLTVFAAFTGAGFVFAQDSKPDNPKPKTPQVPKAIIKNKN